MTTTYTGHDRQMHWKIPFCIFCCEFTLICRWSKEASFHRRLNRQIRSVYPSLFRNLKKVQTFEK